MAEAERKPRNGERGFYPDHDAERRAEFLRTTLEERVAEGIELSRTQTRMAATIREQARR